jgi:hypothetical protein
MREEREFIEMLRPPIQPEIVMPPPERKEKKKPYLVLDPAADETAILSDI